ncbi:MAG: hypothetical protein DRQ48_02340 [Gammaproteobacteria bacterium]|nr:MAG: hypothetical protein DRQ58_03865 [Gammaproteobacteria bacterium]RKZ71820.1 MAG: hypothetical protein DRQ48_02340 [Gammaproteobacteria bacterium]
MSYIFEQLVNPVIELNGLAVESLEQIVNIQIKAFEDNTKIGIYSLNTATEVRDIDSLKTYMGDQLTIAKYISDNILADTQEVGDLGNSYSMDAQTVVKNILPAC